MLERHHVRVVLHHGAQQRVAGAELAAHPAVGDQVARLGRVLREHDAPLVRTDEPREGRAGTLVRVGRLLGEPVDPAVDVRAGGAVVAVHRGEHDLGRLRRRRRVEVDETTTPDLTLEGGELLAERRDVEGHAAQTLVLRRS
jgi:hypothetical protein